ncbi:19204_t:CDS:2, partial [Gigaspora margarita]
MSFENVSEVQKVQQEDGIEFFIKLIYSLENINQTLIKNIKDFKETIS